MSPITTQEFAARFTSVQAEYCALSFSVGVPTSVAPELGEIVTGRGFGGQGTRVYDPAVRQDQFQGHHVILGGAPFGGPDTGGVGVYHSSQGGHRRATGVRGKEMGWTDGPV